MTRLLQTLGLLIALLGCAPYRIEPNYIRPDALPSVVATHVVGFEIRDQRSGEKLLLGRARDLFNRQIESETDPTEISRTAILIALSNAGYSTDDSAERKLVVNLREFAVTWTSDLATPAGASIAMEVRVEEDGELVGSRTYSSSKRVRRKFPSNGSTEGERALFLALTETVNKLRADSQLRNWISQGQVAVATTSGRDGQTGTAFAVARNGVLLTNSHVVALSDGESKRATILRIDSRNDLALLEVEDTHVAPLPFRGTPIPLAEPVVVLGLSLSGSQTSDAHVSTGAVTALSGPGDEIGVLQISAPLEAGDSGGPVLDMSGRVAGVAVAKLDELAHATVTGDISKNANFAVKDQITQAFLEAGHVSFDVSNSEPAYGSADAAEQATDSVFLIRCENRD